MPNAALRFRAGKPEALLRTGDSWQIHHGRVANICDYGASPDASAATNTAAILAAAVEINSGGGGIVFVPSGAFDVTVPSLRFLNYRNVRIQGEGKYLSTLVDPQAMATGAIAATAGAANAFLTFADCVGCGVSDLGFDGANEWSQTRLNTGLTIEARKGIYFQYASVGWQDCFVEDCYFTNIEGETIFTDGAIGTCRNFRCNKNHIYQCQSNAINISGAPDGVEINDNRVDSPGQSAVQLTANHVTCSRNIFEMRGGYTTTATLILLQRNENVLFSDNIVKGFALTNPASAFECGGPAVAQENRIIVSRNTFAGLSFVYAAGNFNGVVKMSATLDDILNFDISDNLIVECVGTTGDGSALVAIRVNGPEALTGRICANKVYGNGIANPLTTGVRLDASTPSPNGIIIDQNDFDASVTTPYSYAASPLSDRTYNSGSKTWDPPNVNNGAQTTTTVTVTNAIIGDLVAVGFSQNLQGMVLSGHVSASNTVTVVLRNDTGGALDLASGTLRARCFKS
jgi:parallel beta helix pectate lyase-like protein